MNVRGRSHQIGALQQMIGVAEVDEFLALLVDRHERYVDPAGFEQIDQLAGVRRDGEFGGDTKLLRQLIAARGAFKFSELFQQLVNRMEVVATFLALLELIRLKQIVVSQPAPFSEIEIWRAPALSTTAAAPDAATSVSNPQTEISSSPT